MSESDDRATSTGGAVPHGDHLVQLLEDAENMGYHHAERDRKHYRSWATVDLLVRLIAVLARKEESDDDSTP